MEIPDEIIVSGGFMKLYDYYFTSQKLCVDGIYKLSHVSNDQEKIIYSTKIDNCTITLESFKKCGIYYCKFYIKPVTYYNYFSPDQVNDSLIPPLGKWISDCSTNDFGFYDNLILEGIWNTPKPAKQ